MERRRRRGPRAARVALALALLVGATWVARGWTAAPGLHAAAPGAGDAGSRAAPGTAALVAPPPAAAVAVAPAPVREEPQAAPRPPAPPPPRRPEPPPPELVEDLAHDVVPGNARAAYDLLERVPRLAEPFLVDALASTDHQQRQLAGCLLMGAGYPPESPLLDVAVEALGRDRIGAEIFVHNAHVALRYLGGHADAARSHLGGGLDAEDPQLRLGCAYLLAWTTEPSAARRRAAHVLVGHLASDDQPGNAAFATAALHHLGAAADDALDRGWREGDAQTRGLVEHLRLARVGGAGTYEEWSHRRGLHDAFWGQANPFSDHPGRDRVPPYDGHPPPRRDAGVTNWVR